MDELIIDFIAEASENLEAVDKELVDLEQHPDKSTLVDDIFRLIHSIKGTCGFFGLDKLASVSHATEEIIGKIRNKQIQADQNTISLILDAVDVIKNIVTYVGKNGKEPDTNYSELIQRITSASLNNYDINKANLELVVEAEPETEKTIRVNVDTLEKLMQSVTELVLNRNELLSKDRKSGDSEISSSLYKLNSITTVLQDAVMETRLQSIGHAWSSVPRMLRDLSKELNKKIKLVMKGESTRLDKQLIEGIRGPIVHMVRNAADHGIESPQERVAANKPAEGTITISAHHLNGHVIIEVSDDGRGMDIARIKKKIIENKLATQDEVALMSDDQAIGYIFSAGFSTNEVITNVSGRGVGMDVVRTNVEDLNGVISIRSIEGFGSTIIISIPLTLAIMQVLMVESSGMKFAIPQINVEQVVELSASSAYKLLEANGQKLLQVRDKWLPCIILANRMKLKSDASVGNFIVICNVQNQCYGIIVDRIDDIESIVLKPLPNLLKKIGIYNGNAMLPNGEIVMVLAVGRLTDIYAQTSEMNPLSLPREKEQCFKYLLYVSEGKYKAIPIEQVSGIKEINASRLQRVQERFVTELDGRILQLVPDAKNYEPADGDMLSIIMMQNQQGLIVEKVIGVKECCAAPNDGVIIIDGKIVELKL